MTHIPQSSEAPDTADASADGDAPARTFEAYLPEPAPVRPSRTPLIVAGACVAALVAGLVFWSGEPDAAEAQSPVLDVSKMTPDQLAEDASMAAAHELARRMVSGTPDQQFTASRAISYHRTPRLSRNLAMAMALEQQKQQQEMRLEVERNRQMVMDGQYGAGR